MNTSVWHLVIIPEDEAYVDLANGFVRLLEQKIQRRICVVPAQGGYGKAYEKAKEMTGRRNEKRIVLVLSDFDSQSLPLDIESDDSRIAVRVEMAKDVCEADGLRQTFVLGPLPEAENLCRELAVDVAKLTRPDVVAENSRIKVGMLFASNDMFCDEHLWQSGQLRHTFNQLQLRELCQLLRRKVLAEIKGARV